MAGKTKTEIRKDALWTICKRFVKEQRISCPETVYQTDRVIENAYKFIDDVVQVVGFYKGK